MVIIKILLRTRGEIRHIIRNIREWVNITSCGQLGVILPVSGSLMYCQEPRSEISSYIGTIPATNAGMVMSYTESLRLT